MILMVGGGCLPVRGCDMMTWKYDDDKPVWTSRNSEACVI